MGRHSFHEEDHPRNPATGEFTTAGIGDWARKVSERMGSRDPMVGVREAAAARRHPAGHTEARNRHHVLWSIPSAQGRERTDAEHEEALRLDDAFATYRETLGLVRNPNDRSVQHTFVGENHREPYNEYGERINRPGGYSQSPSMRHNEDRLDRRRGDARGSPAESGESDPWLTRRTPGRRPREIHGMTPGYVMRSDVHTEETIGRAAVFVARMKQRQPRARQEAARQPVRRTPRGTPIENWMRA